MTLIELLVVLTILGIAAGISSLAMRSIGKPATPDLHRQLLSLRSEAVRRGASLTRLVRDSAGARIATALADGRVLVDSMNAVSVDVTH